MLLNIKYIICTSQLYDLITQVMHYNLLDKYTIQEVTRQPLKHTCSQDGTSPEEPMISVHSEADNKQLSPQTEMRRC